MASFPTSRAGLIIYVVILGGMSVLGVSAAFKAGQSAPLFASLLLAGCLGILIFMYPKRVTVTQEQVSVEYYFRRQESWPLGSLTATSNVYSSTRFRGGLLRLFVDDSKKEVFRISHGLLEKQFEPLINELKSRGVEVSFRVPRSSSSPPRIEVEVDGVREVRYRGGRSVLFASLGICAIVAMGSFLVLKLPWDVQIAEREKLIVCCGVAPFALLAIMFVPRGVMGVVFREDQVIIKRVWRRNLILKREDITALSSRPSRLDESRRIFLITQCGEEVNISENALGSYPGQLWKELAEFAGLEVSPPS